MRSSILSATAVVLAGLKLANGQTFTDCDPTKKTCPADPGLGTTQTTNFLNGKSADWTLAQGTTIKYGDQGAEFIIDTKTDAPTISSTKYINFGKVSVSLRASPGTGTVSSFILESDDLDEIDWEWLGSTDTSVESNFFGKGNTTTYDRAVYHPVAGPIDQFITYTIDWTAESIKWYIGDSLVRTLLYADPLALGGKNYPQTPMRIKMGSWIGCVDAAAASNPATQGTCEWAGGPINLSQGPFTMYVKSVTIQDYGCGGEYSYSDMSGSYQSIKSTCDGNQDAAAQPSASTTAKPSSSTKATTSSTSTSSTTKGAVLVESEAAVSSATSTGSSNSTSSSKSTTALATTTLATTTVSSTASPEAVTSSATSSTPALATTNAGATLKPKHKYGVLDMGVMALGLGLGYLVM